MSVPTRDQFSGSLLGVLVGDSLGAPLEGYEPEQIASAYGQVVDHLPNRYGLGAYTDDTDMTILCAESLLHSNGFDPDGMARHLATHFNPERRYGRGTLEVLERINEGLHFSEAARNIYSPEGSFGNGGALRVAPIASFYHHDIPGLSDIADASSALTHAHPLARAGTRIIAIAIALCLTEQTIGTTQNFLTRLVQLSTGTESVNDYHMKIEQIPALLKAQSTPVEIARILGNDMLALESVPTALYCFLRSPESFEEAIKFALAVGGDTDSIAAMTGALSGAYLGATAIPQPWLDCAEASEKVRMLGEQIHALAHSDES